MPIKDMTGKKFGRLLVIKMSGQNKNGHALWLCKCDCGNERSFFGSNLRDGKTLSCGCYRDEKNSENNSTHGCARPGRVMSEYLSWQQMKSRCTNPNNPAYDRYGGRGIKICDRWINSFENFYADMGPKPGPEYSLDRWPNNESGNYEPSNCRWGTDEEQCKNRRSNVWLEYNGERKIIQDWAREFGVTHGAIYQQRKKRSFPEVVEYFRSKNK